MHLNELAENYKIKSHKGKEAPNPIIKGVTQDSRQVKKGWLFAALQGVKYDGQNFIADAIQHGAVAILAKTGAQLPPEFDANITLITDDNPHRALSLIAAKFYAMQPGHIAAVTGTNGKTSIVHFMQQLWELMGEKGASLGTLGMRGPGMTRPGAMTTPDPVALQAMVADIAAAGVNHLALEASSHGLDQYRLDGLHVTEAGFTNLSRDHLDYHEDMEHYFAAKSRLFSEVLRDDGIAVLNADVPEYEALHDIVEKRGLRELSYGWKGRDIRLLKAQPQPDGQDIEIQVNEETHKIHLPLVGEFQVMNMLCALGLIMAQDPNLEIRTKQIIQLIPEVKRAPGRLELIPGHPKGAIYVDYAHTPEALEMVLTALRPHTTGKLLCIIGCGGDRDKGKRGMMGKIAADLADHVIITDDNPRNEDPATIRAAIQAGAETTGTTAQEISDRRAAIHGAVQNLKEGDVLLIAGKGHEQGQIFADRTEPFDDAEETRKAIGELKKS